MTPDRAGCRSRARSWRPRASKVRIPPTTDTSCVGSARRANGNSLRQSGPRPIQSMVEKRAKELVGTIVGITPQNWPTLSRWFESCRDYLSCYTRRREQTSATGSSPNRPTTRGLLLRLCRNSVDGIFRAMILLAHVLAGRSAQNPAIFPRPRGEFLREDLAGASCYTASTPSGRCATSRRRQTHALSRDDGLQRALSLRSGSLRGRGPTRLRVVV